MVVSCYVEIVFMPILMKKRKKRQKNLVIQNIIAIFAPANKKFA